ncbi:MAG TPA: polymer-forming cytoskeletal protein [Micropepsaceae bacterium]|nr:polymer-forming cytoskeletal protein [Micropepsaceae bacterium]
MLTARWKRAETASEDAPESDISSLSRALTIRGNLDTLGEVHIFGHVIGRINAGRMVIGVGGYVEGDIVAKEVLLCGRLDGRIFAFNVTIAPSAVLKGRVFHHIITVAKEAQIEGRMPWRPINFFETLRDLPKET